MKIGVVLPNTHPTLADPAIVIEGAQLAEQCGLDSVWLNDHVVMPTASVDANAVQQEYARSDILDPLAMLSALAASTGRVACGVSVLVLPYRHPILVAKLVTTAERLAPGRIILGVGSGWMERQFDALGVPFRKRGRLTDEYIAVLEAIFSSDQPAFAGEFVSLEGIRIAPAPTAPIPLWVGGRSENGARRAARHSLPWHPSHWTLEELEENCGWLREHAAELGTEPPPVTFRVKWKVDGTPDAAPGLPADAPAAAEYLRRAQELGVEHLVVEVPAADRQTYLERIRQFGEIAVR